MLKSIAEHEIDWTNVLNGKPVLDWTSHDMKSHYEFAWAVTHFLNRATTKGGDPIVDMVPGMLDAISKGAVPSDVILEKTGYIEAEFIPALTSHFKNRRSHTVKIQIEPDEELSQERACLDYVQVRELLADITRKSNPQRSEHLLKQALARDPDSVRLHVLYSKAMSANKEESFANARKAIELDKADVDANIRMAELLTLECIMSYQGSCTDAPEAIKHYLAALKADHERVDAAFGLGVVYLFVGRAGDALNYLKVAYQRAPWSPRINLYLGDTYRIIGNRVKAREHLRKATLWEADKFWLQRAQMALDSI